MANYELNKKRKYGVLLGPGGGLKDEYKRQAEIEKQREEDLLNRPTTFSERTTKAFSETWKGIGEDVSETSADISGGSRIYGENFNKKVVPTALGVTYRGITSPISAIFSGAFSGNKDVDKGLLTGIGNVFSTLEGGAKEGFKEAGFEDRYAGLAAEGSVGIATGVIGEAAIGRAFKGAVGGGRVIRDTKVAEALKVDGEETIMEIMQFNEASALARDSAVRRGREITQELTEGISSGKLSKVDVEARTKELEKLGATNTNKFLERLDETNTSLGRAEGNSKVIDDIKRKNELSELEKDLNDPSRIPDQGFRNLMNDIKTIRDSGFFNIGKNTGKTFRTGNTPKISSLSKIFGGDNVRIQRALDEYRKITKANGEDDLFTVFEQNRIKSEEFELGLDVEGRQPKLEALSNLEDKGLVVKEVRTDKPNLYSYKLTDKGEQVSKSMGFDDFQINQAKTKGFAEYGIEDVDAFRGSKLEPSILDRTYADMNNLNAERLKPNGERKVSLVALRKSIQDVNDKYSLSLDGRINKIKNYEDAQALIDDINARAEDYFTDVKNIKEDLQVNGLVNSDKLLDNAIMETEKIRATKEGLYAPGSKEKLILAFNKRINKINDDYKAKLEKINRTMRDKGDDYRRAILNIIEEKKVAIASLKFVYGRINEVKADRISEIRKLASAGKILGPVDKAIAKATGTKGWSQITTKRQLALALTRLDKEIAKAHITGLKRAIDKELKNTKSLGLSDAKDYRLKRTPEIEQVLAEIKNLYSANRTGLEDISYLEQLLNEIRTLKSKSKELAHEGEIDRIEKQGITQNKIKTQGIKNIEGTKELGVKPGLLEKVKAYSGKWKLWSNFGYHNMREIFGEGEPGKLNVGVDLFVGKVREAINKKDTYIEKRIQPLGEDLVNTLGDELNDWGAAMLLRQLDDGKFVGYDRIINSPKLSKEYLVKRVSEVGTKPLWISDEIWDKIKNTKLGEVAEKMETNKDWYHMKAKWNSVFDEIYSRYAGQVKKYDGIILPKRTDYFTMLTENYINDIEFGEDKSFFRPIVGNSRAYDVVETTKGAKLDYSTDPIKILTSGQTHSLNQIFIRDIFEEANGVYRGKKYRLKNLPEGERTRLMDTGEWKYVDLDGNDVDINTIAPEAVDDLFIVNEGSGIRNLMNETTREYFDDYMKKLANGGQVRQSGFERAVGKLGAQISANILGFSLTSIVQQPLSLIDASIMLGGKRLMQSTKELMQNPELMGRLETASHALKSRKGDNLIFREVLDRVYEDDLTGLTKKAIREYNKYGLWAMRAVDERTFATILHSAYKEALDKQGMVFKGDYNNAEALRYAENLAEEAAGSGNKMMVPEAFNNVFVKSLFGLMSTQLNRWRTAKRVVLREKEAGNYAKAAEAAGIYTTANLAQILTVYIAQKALYEMDLSSYDPSEKGGLLDKYMSAQTLYDISLGQTPIGGKLSGAIKFDSLSPLEGFISKEVEGIKKLGKKDLNGLAEMVAGFIGDKPYKYIKSSLDD